MSKSSRRKKEAREAVTQRSQQVSWLWHRNQVQRVFGVLLSLFQPLQDLQSPHQTAGGEAGARRRLVMKRFCYATLLCALLVFTLLILAAGR